MVDLLEARMQEISSVNARFWALRSGFPIPLVIYEPDSGRTVHANKQFTQVLGYSADEVAHAESWFHKAYPNPAYREKVMVAWTQKLENALASGRRVEPEGYWVCRKDGETRVIKIGAVLSEQPAMVVLNDITEREWAEKEEQENRDRLEELVQFRTRELVEARDMAARANYAKSIFLANMSHEIINRSGTHLLTLINDILELSKTEAGKVDLSSEPIRVSDIAADVVEMMLPRANQAGISPKLDTHYADHLVLGDCSKIRQALLNLLSNAVKYTLNGRVTVYAKGVVQADQLSLAIHVIDTGTGISKEDQLRILKPFVQVEGSNSQSGTELGPAITMQFFELMGAEIKIRSAPSEGPDFSFDLSLPLAKEEVVKKTVHYNLPGTERKLEKAESKIRVLIAHDVAEIRLLLHELLAVNALIRVGRRCVNIVFFAFIPSSLRPGTTHPTRFRVLLIRSADVLRI